MESKSALSRLSFGQPLGQTCVGLGCDYWLKCGWGEGRGAQDISSRIEVAKCKAMPAAMLETKGYRRVLLRPLGVEQTNMPTQSFVVLALSLF
jgi:hypothetical protein